MNPNLASLQPYPFERLRQLFAQVTPAAAYRPISLGIGEPKHPTPEVIRRAVADSLDQLASYPATAGGLALRQACADWVQRRYGVALDAAQHILPVTGSREALFAVAQAVVNASRPNPVVLCPNPFYQIYEGAALLAGAQPVFVPSLAEHDFAHAWDAVPEAVWQRTQLVYVCSPGNPTGAITSLAQWRTLFEACQRHGAVLVADECYSEIYFNDEPPLGMLQAAQQLGRDFTGLLAVTSLSKRSNAPGLRSGFVAGDPALIGQFLLYRTYHGSAMSGMVQAASAAAWADEAHVVANRAAYQAKFDAVLPLLTPHMQVTRPSAGFYLWPQIPAAFGGDDTRFAQELLAQYNVTVLPGRYIAREVDGHNPGAGRVRMALVAEQAECLEAVQRVAAFCAAAS